MIPKNNFMTIQLPEALKKRIEKFAAIQGVSVDQFAVYAFTKEIGELETDRYFQEKLKNVNSAALLAEMDRILDAVPDRPVPDWDRLEESVEEGSSEG
jgi:FAD synthase